MNKLLILILGIGLLACEQKLEISNATVGLVGQNSLLVEIKFQTSKVSDAYVDYWLEGDSINTIKSSVMSVEKDEHEIYLLGLKENSLYKFKLYVKNASSFEDKGIYEVRTFVLPKVLPQFSIEIGDQDVFDGYIALRRQNEPGVQLLIDSKGDVIWYHMADTAIFRPFSVTGSNSYIALHSEKNIVELTYTGDTLLDLSYGNREFNKTLHHEIIKTKNGEITAITDETRIFDFSKVGGTSADTVKGDGILVLDSIGNLLWQWSIFDATDIEVDTALYAQRKDWSHANALTYDQDGNFLISFRNFNQIWKIDRESGEVVWKLGQNGDFELDDQQLFYQQHSINIIKNGEILLYDNGDVSKRKTTRALAFNIDEDSMIANTTMSIELPDSLFSFKQGSVYIIEDNKLLFCNSMVNKLTVTDLSGEILWQASSTDSFYRAIYIDSPF